MTETPAVDNLLRAEEAYRMDNLRRAEQAARDNLAAIDARLTNIEQKLERICDQLIALGRGLGVY